MPVYVGMDVAAKSLAVAWQKDNRWHEHTFPNTPQGIQKLLRTLASLGPKVRVCMEATNAYHLPAAIALAKAQGIEVMIVNPRAAHNFAQAMLTRSKTDRVDARVLAMFAERMPFEPWQAPDEELLALREIARRIHDLTRQLAAEKNRLATAHDPFVRKDIQTLIRVLEGRIQRMEQEALARVRANPELHHAYKLLLTIPGVGPRSALLLLPEVKLLPEDMTAKQWAAHAGLDPRIHTSGTSVRKYPGISKAGNAHLRRALFMPALVMLRTFQPAKAFKHALMQRGAAPIKAVVALMRRLLIAIRSMLKQNQPFQPHLFLPAYTPQPQGIDGE